MGYIIDNASAGGLVKFETFVPSADVNLLNIVPYDLNIPIVSNKTFALVNAFIQYDGPVLMNNFFYMWIKQGSIPMATYDTRGAIPFFALGGKRVAQFLVNINVDSTGVKNYGSQSQQILPFTLSTDNIFTPRDGNILITTYGYYFNELPPFV